MKTPSLRRALIFSLFVLPFLVACDSQESDQAQQKAEIANPASEYCIEQGGKLEIVKTEAGEKGMCHLPDGTVVEEWELFRRNQGVQ